MQIGVLYYKVDEYENVKFKKCATPYQENK